MRRRCRFSQFGLVAADRLLAAGLLGLVFLLGCFRQTDMDIWWHLKTGRMIRQVGHVPRHDWFTFTSDQADWIDLHWLFQLAASWLYERGGMPLLTLTAASLATVAVALMLAARRAGYSIPMHLLCWLPAVVLLSGRIYVRPEIVSMVCLACCLTVLFRAQRHPPLAWVVLAVLILWVNVQGLFVLGLVLLAFWAVDQIVRHLAGERAMGLGGLTLLGASALAVCALNPYGIRGLVFPLELFRKMTSEAEFYSGHIAELESIGSFARRVGYRQLYLLVHLGLLGVGTLSFLLAWSRRQFDLFRLLSFAAFGWLSLQATRNSGQFALVSGAVLAWNVGDWASRGRRSGAGVGGRALVGRGLLAATLVLACWAVASGRFYTLAGEGRLVGLDEQPLWHGHQAAKFAARTGMPSRMLAYHLGQAALFEFYMRQDQRVFCDPRLEVVSRETLAEYHRLAEAIASGRPGWADQLKAWEVSMILADHRDHFGIEAALLVSSGWDCVHFDPVAALFLTKGSARAAGVSPVDWAGRHFLTARRLTSLGAQAVTGQPPGPMAEVAEARALVNVARLVQDRFAGPEPLVRAMLLLACDNCRTAMRRYPDAVEPWRWLAQASYHLGIEHGEPPDASDAPWLPAAMLDLARARHCLHRWLARAPDDFLGWTYKFFVARRQGDLGTALLAGRKLRELAGRQSTRRQLIERLKADIDALEVQLAGYDPAGPVQEPANLEQLDSLTTADTAAGLFERAVAVFEAATGPAARLSWPLADRYGRLLLHCGRPAEARAVWQQRLAGPYDQAVRLERIADAYLIEGDYEAAARTYRQALSMGGDRPAAVWGLCRCLLETGRRVELEAACLRALAADKMGKPAVREAIAAMLELATLAAN